MTVQEQVRQLHQIKGMSIKEAIKEIEDKLMGKLPETLINQIYYEATYWR